MPTECKTPSNISSHCKMSQLFFKVTSEGGTKTMDASQTKATLSLKIKKVQG